MKIRIPDSIKWVKPNDYLFVSDNEDSSCLCLFHPLKFDSIQEELGRRLEELVNNNNIPKFAPLFFKMNQVNSNREIEIPTRHVKRYKLSEDLIFKDQRTYIQVRNK